jgi:hypothetical protein
MDGLNSTLLVKLSELPWCSYILNKVKQTTNFILTVIELFEIKMRNSLFF